MYTNKQLKHKIARVNAPRVICQSFICSYLKTLRRMNNRCSRCIYILNIFNNTYLN